jgi:uncharacterized protein DUF4160
VPGTAGEVMRIRLLRGADPLVCFIGVKTGPLGKMDSAGGPVSGLLCCVQLPRTLTTSHSFGQIRPGAACAERARIRGLSLTSRSRSCEMVESASRNAHNQHIYGILIRMFFNDHPPPHFHARFGEFEATVEIGTLEILEGQLPRRL